jgi:hypothetical protein
MTASPSDNVLHLADVSDIQLTPTQLFAKAAGARLQAAMVLGIDQDGEMYVETSQLTNSEAVWLMEKFKFVILTEANE